MKHYKFVVSILLVFALTVLPMTNVFATNETQVSSPYIVKTLLEQDNGRIMQNSSSTLSEVNVATVAVFPNECRAEISFTIDGFDYDVDAYGLFEEVDVDSISGLVGYVEGYVSPQIGDDMLLQYGQSSVLVGADITCANNDVTLLLNIGWAGVAVNPIVIMFGECSESIAAISNAYISTLDLPIENSDGMDNRSSVTPRATTPLRGTRTYTRGGYNIGTMSVLHWGTLYDNADKNIASVSLNTNFTNTSNYLKTILPDDASILGVKVDRAEISMTCTSNNMAIKVGSLLPTTKTTTYTFLIPLCWPAVGYTDIYELQLPVSTSTASLSTDRNTASWTMTRSSGWDVNGSYLDGSAVSASCNLTESGTASSYQYLSSSANMRVLYVYYVDEYSQTTGHFTTTTETANTVLSPE